MVHFLKSSLTNICFPLRCYLKICPNPVKIGQERRIRSWPFFCSGEARPHTKKRFVIVDRVPEDKYNETMAGEYITEGVTSCIPETGFGGYDMYNFSGIVFRIVGVCGIMLLLGIGCILLEKPWSKNFKIQKCKLGLLLIIFAVCSGLVYASRIVSPKVSSYTGEFIETHRNSRVAPPLPVTNEYVFWNGEGKKQVFYLDIFSKKEIFPDEFENAQKYTIYFDDFTNVIVKVEIVE